MRLLILILLLPVVAGAQQISSAYPNAAWGAGEYLGIARYIHPSHTPGTKDPVIIWMHGNGGASNYTSTSQSAARTAADLLRGIGSSEGGLPNDLEDGVDISARKANNGANPLERFVVISPAQDISHDGFATGINENYIDYVWQYMRDSLLDYVDTTRVYIVGWSGGGNGVVGYPSRTLGDANKIAAIVPIASVPLSISGGESYCHIANSQLPVWAFHAQNDGTVSHTQTNNLISQINSTCGATVPALYWHPATGGHTGIVTAALTPSNRYSDASGVDAPTTSMNIYEWMLQYERSLDGSGSGLCGNAYRLPIPEYRVYDFSSYSAYYKGLRTNVAGSGSAQFLFRDDYDPKNGVTPPADTITRYYGMPRNSNNLNAVYRDGFIKIWVDFRRKVYIDTMVILHNTYTTDSFYVILDHDSTFWNTKGSIRGIPNTKAVAPVLSVRPPSNNGNNLTTTYRINDSARFMLLLIKNNKVTHSADSMFRPLRIALYGCTDDPIAINDSTWTGSRKEPLPIGVASGSNFTNEELAFGPGQTRDFLWPEKYYRRYQLRGPNYAFDNDSTQQFQINNRANSYNFSLDNYVSEETFFEGITGWDSVMYSRYQPYIFRCDQGASAYVAKQARDAGIASSTGKSYDWAPIDSIGKDYKQPASYARAGDMAYHIAAIHGSVAVDTNFLRLRYRGGEFARTGMNIHRGLQNGNEDNGGYRERPQSPIEYDALSQAMYDGDEGTIGPRIGMKNADPNMQFISTGIAQYDIHYGRSIMYLSRMNRTDRKMIYDVMSYHAYWVTWDDKVTTAEFGFSSKAYPESDTALHILNTLADETYIQAQDTVATMYGEYGTDHHYKKPVDMTESFSVSIYSAPKYRNAAGVILDSLTSHAIDVMRDQFTMNNSWMLWGTQYVYRDLVDTAGNKFAAYLYSGKINPFNGIKWKLWYLDAAVKRRLGAYKRDQTISYEDKGMVIYKMRHIGNPDSVLYVLYHADTLGTESFTLDVGSVSSAKEWHESYTSEYGTESDVTVTGGEISGTASPEFTFYIVHETENQSPTAAAGTDQSITLPTSQVTVNGSSSSDPDGTIDTYLWTKISGPATFTITNPNSSSTTITGLVAGTYVFRLTVTDDDGAQDTDEITITVNAAPASNRKQYFRGSLKNIFRNQ